MLKHKCVIYFLAEIRLKMCSKLFNLLKAVTSMPVIHLLRKSSGIWKAKKIKQAVTISTIIKFNYKGRNKVSIEMLKQFCGKGDALLSKIKLVTKLCNITDVACLKPLCLKMDTVIAYG